MKKKNAFLLITAIALAGMFIGCSSSGNNAPEKVTVTFDLNGADSPSSITPIKVEKGKTMGSQFPAAPGKAEHTFGGWYLSSSTGFTGGSTWSARYTADTTINSDTSLKARWIAGEAVTITFNTDGGGNIPNVMISKGTSMGGLFPQPPEKSGYAFFGWYLTSDTEFEGPSYTASTIINEDTALMAKWDVYVGADSEPYNISNSFGEDASTVFLAQWHNGPEVTAQKIQYVVETGDWTTATTNTVAGVEFSSTGEDGEFDERRIFRATVTGLTPNTRYKYRVGDEGLWSDTFYHRTASASFAEFSFTLVSDPQESVDSPDAPEMDLVLSKAVEFDEDSRFFLMAGDITNEIAKEPDEIVNYTNVANKFNVRRPILATQGNHDTYGVSGDNVFRWNTTTNGKIFNAFVSFPRNGHLTDETKALSYYFYYNDVLVVMLNSMVSDQANAHAAQANWLREILQADKDASKSKYRIVVSHVGPFAGRAVDRYFAKPIRDAYGQIMSDFDVHVFFSGHDHIYTRTNPIRLSGTNIAYASVDPGPTAKGTVYSIVSSTGPKLYAMDSGADNPTTGVARLAVKYTKTVEEQEPGIFVNVKVTAEKLIVTAMRADGVEIDSYEVMADGSVPGGGDPSGDCEFCGATKPCVAGTSIPVKLGSTTQNVTLTRYYGNAAANQGTLVYSCANSYTYTKSGEGHRNRFAWFSLDLGEKKLSDFGSVKFNYSNPGGGTDVPPNHYWVALIARTTTFADLPNGGILAHHTGGSSAAQYGSGRGYLGVGQVSQPFEEGLTGNLSGDVEFLINDHAANVVYGSGATNTPDATALAALDATGVLYFSFYEHINVGHPGTVANIEFVEK